MFHNLLKNKRGEHGHKGSAGDLLSRLKKHKVLPKFFPGFTLIELLVVIAILGILSTVVMGSVASAREKARDTKRKQDVRQVDTAINLYIDDNGGSPPDLGVPGCIDLYNSDIACIASSQTHPENWAVLQTQLLPYISELPSDPCINCSGDIVFEYIYHAPAAVNASLDPVVPDFTSRSYSIYTNALERNEEEAFGYGPSVPELSEEGDGGLSGPVPTVDITASPNPTLGVTSTISWTSSNVTSCTASGAEIDWTWFGVKSTSGSQDTPVPFSGADLTYTITCTGDHGSVSDSVILDLPIVSPL